MRRATAVSSAIFALAFTAVLAGCWNGRVLYAFERPFLASLGDETALRLSLARVSLSNGYLPSFSFEPGADPVSFLLQGSSAGYSAVVVGPLLSFQWAQFASGVHAAKLVLVDVPPSSAAGLPPNAVLLTFDRAAAFAEAGRAAAEWVRTSADAATPAQEVAARIGVLAADRTGLLPDEAEAFSLGAAQQLNGARPVSRTLPAVPDVEAVRAAVTQMRGQGVLVFLLGLGERDPAGLEAVRDAGAVAVVSDWQQAGALPPQVLASIEEDIPAGIARALAASGSGPRVVAGPVRLVRGRKI